MRNRIWQSALILVVLTLGLLSRSRAVTWPWWVTFYLGDVLWGWAVFLGIGWLRTRWTTRRVALGALTLAVTIEFSQLVHTPWLDVLRAHRLAALVLGQGFLWSDLICYVIGITVGAALERTGRK